MGFRRSSIAFEGEYHKMVLRRATKYPLPNFPSAARPTFESLCQPITDDGIGPLRAKVDSALQAIVQRARHFTVDLYMAKEVANRCHLLLDQYHGRSDEERALIAGAVRYFAVADDPLPDTVFATGLDDDAKIVNHVLERLGIEGHFIRIP